MVGSLDHTMLSYTGRREAWGEVLRMTKIISGGQS
jgi:hypothetical protein